jgi:hypothetical protein
MAQRDIDAQVARLEQMRTKYVKAAPELLLAIEQALATALVAREICNRP